MSQNDLALKLNVSRQAISRWENGNNVPDFDKLIDLSDIFNISVDQLLGKEVIKETPENNLQINNYTQPRNNDVPFLVFLSVLIIVFLVVLVITLLFLLNRI